MIKNNKTQIIEELVEKFNSNSFFYLTDSSTLTVAQVNDLRRKCFENNVEIKVVKNTLARKAMEQANDSKAYVDLYDSLKGPTALMFSSSSSVPAKVIEEFRKKNKRPILKAAHIDGGIYIGDDQLKILATLKSKEDLIGEIILLLQSPAKNVISSLQSGKNILAGLVKTLQEREQ